MTSPLIKLFQKKANQIIYFVFMMLFLVEIHYAQLPIKRDDFNYDTRKLWWQYDLEGPATAAYTEDGTLVLQLTEANSTIPWTNTSIWDGHNMYSNVTVSIRAKAINQVRPGSRGWGLWYTTALSSPTEQAWFMQVGDDPAYSDYNSSDVWWRAQAMNMYQNPSYIEELDLTADVHQWHTYKIVRDMSKDEEFTFFIDDVQVMQSQNVQIESQLSVQIWNDNLVYYRTPNYGYHIRSWSGGIADKFVLDYVEVLSEAHPGESIAPAGTIALREIPFEVSSGASGLLWKNYSFNSNIGNYAIIITARAEQYGTYGEDDELKIVVDGQDYGWGSQNSFDGSILDGISKTIVLDTTLQAGQHTIQLWANQTPILYDVTVLGSATGSILINDSLEQESTTGSNKLFKTYNFSCDPGEVTIYISGTADEDITPANRGRYYSNFDDDDDDDIRLELDGVDYGWQNDDAIWGNRLFGESKSILISDILTGGNHTLRIYTNNTPIIHRVLVYSEHGDYSLPVTLSSFNGRWDSEAILLTWTTQSELNNLGFNIYRADFGPDIDELNYTQLNTSIIPGRGNKSDKTEYQYQDLTVQYTRLYWYKLEDISLDGTKKQHSLLLVEPSNQLISDFSLYQNFPNPFNNITTIRFRTEKQDHFKLDIIAVDGRVIKTLLNTRLEPGTYTYEWNSVNNNNEALSSGIYFYRVISSNKTITKKMLLIQ